MYVNLILFNKIAVGLKISLKWPFNQPHAYLTISMLANTSVIDAIRLALVLWECRLICFSNSPKDKIVQWIKI